MYADEVTRSMERAINETNRRRKIQDEYNKKHNITPKTIKKGIREIIEATIVAEEEVEYKDDAFTKEEIEGMILGLETAMLKAAEELNFEKAAELRDKIIELRKKLK